MLWYFMLRGAASFYEEHGRWPGSPSFGVPSTARTAAEGDDEQFSPHVVEQDLPYLRNHVNRVLISSEVAVNRVSDDFVHVRFFRHLNFISNRYCFGFVCLSCLRST